MSQSCARARGLARCRACCWPVPSSCRCMCVRACVQHSFGRSNLHACQPSTACSCTRHSSRRCREHRGCLRLWRHAWGHACRQRIASQAQRRLFAPPPPARVAHFTLVKGEGLAVDRPARHRQHAVPRAAASFCCTRQGRSSAPHTQHPMRPASAFECSACAVSVKLACCRPCPMGMPWIHYMHAKASIVVHPGSLTLVSPVRPTNWKSFGSSFGRVDV